MLREQVVGLSDLPLAGGEHESRVADQLRVERGDLAREVFLLEPVDLLTNGRAVRCTVGHGRELSVVRRQLADLFVHVDDALVWQYLLSGDVACCDGAGHGGLPRVRRTVLCPSALRGVFA
jgi:hypothetical protein